MVNDDEPSSNNRPGLLGDPAQESSVAKVLAGAGQATPPGRSIKPMLQLRYATHLLRNRGRCGCRAGANSAKAIPVRKASSNALSGTTGVRTRAWGERIGRVNWGPSAAGGLVRQPDGIIHKPPGGRQRRRCGHSKRRAGRTIQPVGEPRATGLAVLVRSSGCRLVARHTTDKPPGNQIPTVMASCPFAAMPERADTLEAIGLIIFAPLLYSMKISGFSGDGIGHGLLPRCCRSCQSPVARPRHGPGRTRWPPRPAP